MSVPRIRAVLPAEGRGCPTGGFTIMTVLAMKQRNVLHLFIPSPPFPVAFQAHFFPTKLRAAEFQTARHTETEPWWDWVTIQNQPPLNPQQSRWYFLLLGRPPEWQEEKENSQGKSGAFSLLLGFFHARMYETVFSLVFSVVSLQYICCPRSWLNLCLISFLPEGRGSPISLQVLKKLFFCLRYHDCQEW